MGLAVFGSLPKRGFVVGRLVSIRPVPGAWLVSGALSSFPRSAAAGIAQVAIDMATRHPQLAFRNPEKVEQGWRQMREDRAMFMEFFGTDELVFPPAEAVKRLNTYYQHRQEAALARNPKRRPRDVIGVDRDAFEVPAGLADSGTIGIIYDEVDGLSFYNEYGALRDLFADPALAADKRYSEVLRGYLGSKAYGPMPLRRMAAACPMTVDAVYRKVLRKPNFTWSEHGEALLRRRKAWYYEREPRPGFTVIGERLSELAGL